MGYTKKQWRDLMAPLAQRVGAKYGIPWQAIVVQTDLETGRGNSKLFWKWNNFGGIKFAGSGAPSKVNLRTREVIKGRSTYIMADFAVWNDRESGLEGYCKFFHRNKRYKTALQYPNDPYQFIVEIRKAGYATGENYIQILHDKLRSYFPDGAKFTYQYESWNTEIGGSTSNSLENSEYEPIRNEPPPLITNVEERPAVGIWQVVKLLADRYALDQSINDAVISSNQGSLINFVNKVVQEPWLEFFGDTYRDQYYFTARKERFDYNGFKLTFDTSWAISENEAIADDLSWYNGPVYSWYQIIPQGSFLGEQNQIFAHVTAVFFQEYAEVFGSKPLSVVNNYINFVKNQDGPILYEKALSDLRYMVESNCYLPFTREGTITIVGRPELKRGYWIFYKPTREMFYIDGVNHRYVSSDSGEEMVTTLKVSRGMEFRHLVAPKNERTKSYWNLILFEDPKPDKEEIRESTEEKRTRFFFDNDRSYLMIKDESWPPSPDTRDRKMELQILEFPSLREELFNMNQSALEESIRLIEDNPQCEKFYCIGFIDSDFGNKNARLPIGRANTVKETIVNAYISKHPTESRQSLFNRIEVTGGGESSYSEEDKANMSDQTEKKYKEKAMQRYAEFVVPTYEKKREIEKRKEGVNWRVNDEVFQYFLNRKQNNNCN